MRKVIGSTIYECIELLRNEHERGHLFLKSNGQTIERSYASTCALAMRAQARFQSDGLRAGERVALVVEDEAMFVPLFLGAVRAGLIPVPIGASGSASQVEGRIKRILDVASASALVCSRAQLDSMLPLRRALGCLRWVQCDEDLLADHALPEAEAAELSPEDICFLQFTSGSTGAPKGVVVRHKHVAANAKLILTDSIPLEDNDRVVSWLPMHHDMGLIGKFLSPLFYALPVIFIPTSRFVRSPKLWMEAMSEHKGTITFAPNFAFALALRRIKSVEHLDLRHVRVVGCGAEPINARVLRRFASGYAAAGLPPEAVVPCYGMAEATLAISFDRLDRAPRTLRIDRSAYEREGKIVVAAEPERSSIEVVSCGTTRADHALRIVGRDGRTLPPGHVGEIVFAGPSVADGYYQDREATSECFVDGELRTGDLGFLHDGDLYVSGRMKDLIVVNGRNYYPQDIEWLATGVAGVRPGGAVAFSISREETEEVCLIVELDRNATDAPRQIAMLAEEQLGIAIQQVVAVRPMTIPKTTSGKVQRSLTKNMFLTGRLAEHRYAAPGSAAQSSTAGV